MQTLRRISVGSAFKIGAITYALLVAIIGGIFLIIQLLFGGIIAASMAGNEGANALGPIFGLGALAVVFYIGAIIFYAVVGGIGTALAAFIYNIVAGMVGGLRIELED